MRLVSNHVDAWTKYMLERNYRGTLIVLIAAALSFILALSGHQLIYRLLSVPGADDKQIYFSAMLLEMFLLLPFIAIAIGLVVGLLDDGERWWLAGIALAPLLGYLFVRSLSVLLTAFSLVYEVLSMVSAYSILHVKQKLNRLKQI